MHLTFQLTVQLTFQLTVELISEKAPDRECLRDSELS